MSNSITIADKQNDCSINKHKKPPKKLRRRKRASSADEETVKETDKNSENYKESSTKYSNDTVVVASETSVCDIQKDDIESILSDIGIVDSKCLTVENDINKTSFTTINNDTNKIKKLDDIITIDEKGYIHVYPINNTRIAITPRATDDEQKDDSKGEKIDDVKYYETVNSEYSEDIEERWRKIMELSNSTEDLVNIMRILSESVDSSQNDIDTIEREMISLKDNARSAMFNLEKAKEYMKSASYIKYAGICMGTIIVSVPLSVISAKLGAIAFVSGIVSGLFL